MSLLTVSPREQLRDPQSPFGLNFLIALKPLLYDFRASSAVKLATSASWAAATSLKSSQAESRIVLRHSFAVVACEQPDLLS